MSLDGDARQLADDLAAAVSSYAALFGSAVAIAADGATAEELAEWSADCFDEAVSMRLLDADSIGFADEPEDAGVLVNELYESLVILSGVERVAHALSMPVSTCADGTSIATLLREKGELGRWYGKIVGRPFSEPDMPASLVSNSRRGMVSPIGFSEKRQAASADRELAEEERSKDLNDVFAGRISDAMRRYAETVEAAENGPFAPELQASLVGAARAETPALLGFSRLADRRIVGLDAPPAAAPVARMLARGFVTLAAAETSEDVETLPFASPEEVADAARPLRGWLGRLGTL